MNLLKWGIFRGMIPYLLAPKNTRRWKRRPRSAGFTFVALGDARVPYASMRPDSREPNRWINRLKFSLYHDPNVCNNRPMGYNWQQSDWPNFRYDLGRSEADLLAFADKAGQVSGILRSLPQSTQTEAVLDVMIAEAIKTSEIEGEFLSRQDVLSSIRNQLGLNAKEEPVRDQASHGAAQLMVAVREDWNQPLSQAMLFEWRRMLMQGNRRVKAGGWRLHEEPMQVVSGAVGKEKIHFEAPPSAQVPAEMAAFIEWFNASRGRIAEAPVRAAVAHIYFETIHPFEDGNGRIGRAISEKALSQGLGRPAFLSLSPTIEANKKAYYTALE